MNLKGRKVTRLFFLDPEWKCSFLPRSQYNPSEKFCTATIRDESMQQAAQRVVDLSGGLVACNGIEVIAALALPVAGLMSEEPITVVDHAYNALL